MDGSALSASLAADGALLRRVGGEEAAAFRATTQVVVNVGISLGVGHLRRRDRAQYAGRVVNTILVVLFQVRVGKNVQTVKQGGAALRQAGVIFFFSCSAIGLATGLPAWAAMLALAGAVALHTYGELWHASASFALNFGLAPAHAQGQYQGLIGVGNGAGQAAALMVLSGRACARADAGGVTVAD